MRLHSSLFLSLSHTRARDSRPVNGWMDRRRRRLPSRASGNVGNMAGLSIKDPLEFLLFFYSNTTLQLSDVVISDMLKGQYFLFVCFSQVTKQINKATVQYFMGCKTILG